MIICNILYITLAVIFALGFAFFQYLYKAKGKAGNAYIFFILRFLSIFTLLLLLINPKIRSTAFEIEKPDLLIAIDNSQSIAQLRKADTLRNFVRQLLSNEEIRERFKVREFSFGKELSAEGDLDFNEPQTNIFSALDNLNNIYKNNNAALVLISDGNQSIGRDFGYFKASANISLFPVVVGDTTRYSDLNLAALNVNRYAFLNNRFPVEAIINYSGEEPVNTNFEIRSGENILFSKSLSFSAEENSAIINTTLPASRLGVLSYKAEVAPSENEKNQLNNSENFAVEVIDERTKVLILSATPHPDLGALKKAIETNEQRQAEIKYLKDEELEIQDFQLVIMYQPNNSFKPVFEKIKENNQNYFVITGTQTEWDFLNNVQDNFKKDAAFQEQEIFAVMNPGFSNFQFEDIGFEDFPPLLDRFGTVETSNSAEPLLFQRIEGVETGEPLLAISEGTSSKSGFLLGENIWKWRAQSYLENQNFEAFDNFFGKIIQNLSSRARRDRLRIDYESFYYGNSQIIVSAQYFDENYQFDANARLNIAISKRNSDESLQAPLLLRNNYYEVDLGNLEPGEYEFTLRVENSAISETGSFTVVDYNVEQQFASANLEKLKFLADNNESRLYFSNSAEKLIQDLLSDKRFTPVQKSHEKTVPLVDWYYLLFLLVFFLAGEWFYRKYTGLI
ncbi:VWA domain-containing protein [Zunongwangia sp. F363]|uniref:VWA domain-containing protein n=1 Tax=Autumnicola tepida TaxID=3075595 RepID=A0ABU3CCD5_9FLAO|nr:VWA domain-containing protein [Zunongwangia sp. F363]MDT0643994.1 VWA domain-containing protein [Zunongwangia sp. F363]